jgi:hypothetical protein
MLNKLVVESYKFDKIAPISQTNWVTIDGMPNPIEARYNPGGRYSSEEDWEEYDQRKITVETDAGFFYNQHCYPYYPEFLTYHPDNQDGFKIYLDRLRDYYNDKPFIITEIGLSTSTGLASSEMFGRNHGNLTHIEQGQKLYDLLEMIIYTVDMDGVVLFQLHDEWFKKSWNTKIITNPEEPNRQMWHNTMSAEEGFGLFSVEPQFIIDSKTKQNDYFKLTTKHDEAFLYVDINTEDAGTIIIGFDTLLGGNQQPNGLYTRFNNHIDSYLVIDTTTGETNYYIHGFHDTFLRQYGWWLNNLEDEYPTNQTLGLENDVEAIMNPNNGYFNKYRMLVKTPTFIRPDGSNEVYQPFKVFELNFNNPGSLSLVNKTEEGYSIKLPYNILGYSNPGQNEKMIMGDLTEHGKQTNPTFYKDTTGITVEALMIIGGTGGLPIDDSRMIMDYSWDNWSIAKCYCERAKGSVKYMQNIFGMINDIDNLGQFDETDWCSCSGKQIPIHGYILHISGLILVSSLLMASVGKFLAVKLGYCYGARKVEVYSPRLMALNFLLALSLIGLYIQPFYTPTISYLSWSYIFYILIIIWDSLILVVVMLTVKWDLHRRNNRFFEEQEHAFIIACHNSSDVIRDTLQSLLEKVAPQQIYVADNGSTKEEQRKTRIICNEMSNLYPGGQIHYGCSPIGNKTIAQYASVCAVEDHIKYITCIDDDTRLDKTWDVNKVIKYFEDDKDVAVLAYPLSVYDPQYEIEWFQAMEYLIVGYIKIFHSKVYSTIFNSGAFGTYRKEILKEALLYHNTDYHGDDLQICMNIHQLKGKKFHNHPNKIHTQDYKVATATDMIVSTIAPKCWFHIGKCDCNNPDLLSQRSKGWFVSMHRFIPRYIKLIINSGGTAGRWWVRLIALYELVLILNEYFAIFYLIFFLRNFGFWLLEGFIIGYAFNVLTMTILNWRVFRKNDLYIPYEVITIQPFIYKLIMITIYRYIGLFYNMFVYSIKHKSGTKIIKRIQDVKFTNAVENMYTPLHHTSKLT